MAATKQQLEDIRNAGIDVRLSLADLEALIACLVRRHPNCPRIQSLKLLAGALHQDLSTLRETILEALPITPLDDDEIIILGGPGGGK